MRREIVFGFVFLILLAGGVFAQSQSFTSATGVSNSYRDFSSPSSRYGGGYGSSSFINYQGGYSAERLYGSQASTYWPQLSDPIESCRAREDIILQVSPAGCQPAVVRSDLLAEQNVPVFCQVDALKLNPLIDIQQIRNIRFVGDYPPEVAGVGFHPARAALRSQDRLLGSPLINNIGYVVIVMKQNEIEESLPDFVNFTLHAQVEYHSGNSFGIGRSSFLISESSDSEWELDKDKQTFWQGRYSVRLENAVAEHADVSIYHGDRKISTVRAERGRQSNPIYVPGFYCQSGVQVAYDGFVSADSVATILADDDVLQVTRGTRFLNDKCVVREIRGDAISGSVDIQCGSERISLAISQRNLEMGDEVYLLDENGHRGSEIWNIVSSNEDNYTVTRGEGENRVEEMVAFNRVRPVESGVLADPNLGNVESYFDSAIGNYTDVFESYPLDPLRESVAGEEREIAGEVALINAIELAARAGKQEDRARFIEDYLDSYSNSTLSAKYRKDLDNIYTKDLRNAGRLVNLDNKVTSIRLLEIDESRKPSLATFRWGTGSSFEVIERQRVDNSGAPGIVTLVDVVSPEEVIVSVTCPQQNQENVNRERMFVGASGLSACGGILQVEDIELNEFARIRLNPSTRGTATQTNFSVGVGIEKRAIKLSPEKAREKIDNLQDNIDRWSGLSNNLESAVEGLKAACFATSAALTAKNFLTGLSGEGFARKNVMDNYWTKHCNERVAAGEFFSVNECFLENNGEIERDVSALTGIFNADNEKIKSIQQGHTVSSGVLGGLIGEGTVDGAAARVDLVNQELKQYENFDVSDFGLDNVDELGDLINDDSAVAGDVSLTMARDILANVQISQSEEVSPGVASAARENIKRDLIRVIENKKIRAEIIEDRESQGQGEPSVSDSVSPSDRDYSSRIDKYWNIVDRNSWSGAPGFGSEVTHVAKVKFISSSDLGINTGIYVLGLSKEEQGYSLKEVWKGNERVDVNIPQFESVYRIGSINHVSEVSYSNKYLESPELRYYETEPYKGYPAIVPFDTENGWYAAVEQNLPFGGRGNYDQSGRPAIFWVCNIGKDGRQTFFEDRGKDICVRFDINSGQAFDEFPGLSNERAGIVISRAQEALRQASLIDDENRRGSARILDSVVEIGAPASGKPGTQCQDFMSARECQILFNVCDPVVCPNSRCDFGGKYPVADVIQTGIVGSALLCLPNVQEGVFVPVCLTGIQAGIDGYVSILESYQQCLQENIDTGRTVGICDQITSVYMCEFFWRQAAPLADVLVPKAFEVATGQSRARGGGEYLNVQNAWDSTQGSIDFFTQNYAKNSLEAFRIRSTAEAGSQVCRAFISAKGPNAFDTLIEADSPVQYHSWFSETPYTSATVPATSQYKVFYHIFSGNDQGSNFRIYLKSPSQSSFFSVSPSVEVSSGFIPRGQFLTDTVDFTAPEGYKELCVVVNGNEQCGFKQVSTSFAINQLRDEFVNGEITNSQVTTENGCVSGGVSPLALLNPGVQGVAEEAVSGSLSARGITRICATQNPGLSTEPGRFTDVGYCGNQDVRCWLDKKSVDSALTDNNVGVRDRTISEIEDIQFGNLARQGEVFDNGTMEEVIRNIESRVSSYGGRNPKILTENEARLLISEISLAYDKAFFNHHKARLIILMGDVNAAYVRQNLEIKDGNKPPVEDDDLPLPEGSFEDVDSGGEVDDSADEEVNGDSIIEDGEGVSSEYAVWNSIVSVEGVEIGEFRDRFLYGERADGGQQIRIGEIVSGRLRIHQLAFGLSDLLTETRDSLSYIDGSRVITEISPSIDGSEEVVTGLVTCSVSFYHEFSDGSIENLDGRTVSFSPGDWYFEFENCPANVEAVLSFEPENSAVETSSWELDSSLISSGRFEIGFSTNPQNPGEFRSAFGTFHVEMIHPVNFVSIADSYFGLDLSSESGEAYFTVDL